MRLALRLALTFGLLAAGSSVLVGLAVRYRLAETETARFREDVRGVCERINAEVRRQGEADRMLITGFCAGGELVERIGIALDNGELDDRRLSFASLVRTDREAFGVDELLVGLGGGEIVGASPSRLLGLPRGEVDALITEDPSSFVLRTGELPGLVTRCTKASPKGRLVGMVATRHLDPTVDRVAKTLGIVVVPSWPKRPVGATDDETPDAPAPPLASDTGERATCQIEDGRGAVLPFEIVKPTGELEANLAEVDRAVGAVAVLAAIVAFLVAVILARTIGRPLSLLAREAGKVAAGEAQPIEIRGSGEIRELGLAFDRMITDLATTRSRLADASRVAAWREVARRVAHEVKNPLAPIRAAVETLRRLRARDDPRFDEYFDEATRTVLDEVHRISTIVTEFTRFARLPPPRLQAVDPKEIAGHVVQAHAAAAGDVRLTLAAGQDLPALRADRDQIVQVLTNLVQNALEALDRAPGGVVTVTVESDGQRASFTVTDNGPGLAPELAARLFEPYATTKATGTGLGLAIAQRIAYEHGGELSYVGAGRGGSGAAFRLVLPVSGPPPSDEAP